MHRRVPKSHFRSANTHARCRRACAGLNPDAAPAPCTVPASYEPVVLMHQDSDGNVLTPLTTSWPRTVTACERPWSFISGMGALENFGCPCLLVGSWNLKYLFITVAVCSLP